MAVLIPRLRIWFAVMALAVAAAAAGFYVYARHEQRLALKNLPAKIGIDIQQSSEGFTLSKSEGGRTTFSIHASKVLQYKEGGRAHLQDVNIIVYGRNSDRFDQIYGNDFDYDQKQGTVVARGEVLIDLEGNSEGHKLDDQLPPREMKNPIHLRAEGLTFNQKTGIAETDGLVDFRVPQAAGTARGATYSTHDNVLTLHSAVDVRTEGRQATHIVASSGVFTKDPRVLVMSSAELTSDRQKVSADHATLDLAANNAIQFVHAQGNVRLTDEKGIEVHSPRAELKLGERNTLETAHFLDGVEMVDQNQGANGHSGEMLLHFATVPVPKKAGEATAGVEAQLQTVDAIHGVVLHHAAPEKGENPQETAIASNAMTFYVSGGRLLRSAETLAPGQVTMRATAPQHKGELTLIDAQHFIAEFGDQNQLRTVHGTGAVKVTSKAPKLPDKVSTSATMVAEFTPAGEVSRVVQEGNFRYREPQSSANELGGRTAFADRANYSPQDNSLTLLGSPRVVDGGITVTADSIRLLRGTGEAFAQGNVKTTYSELKVQPNGALLATADPIHVTSRAMNAVQLSGLAHYTGNARLWQGSNIVEAQTIDFDQKARTIVAVGDRKHPVTSIFLQVDSAGKFNTMLVTAPRLNYADNDRRAIYSGGVTARSEDGVMTADRAEVFLNAASATRSAGPSQLDHIVATTHVLVQQQERRAQGEHLLYTAANGTYVITGGSPMLSDPVNGTVHGDSLTFYSRDDRVVVEGNGSSRTVTHTHISH
jgi:lipopolysaccharide export system protein LptA